MSPSAANRTITKAPDAIAPNDARLADKTIYLFIPSLDKQRNDYTCAFMFRGRGCWRVQKAPITMPDFLAWMRASMPRPYPVKVNEEHTEELDRIDYDCGLSIERTAAGVAFTMQTSAVAEAVA